MNDYKSYRARRKSSFLAEDLVRIILEGSTLILFLSLIACLFVLLAVPTGFVSPLHQIAEVMK